nr:protein bud22 [Quercus suber]
MPKRKRDSEDAEPSSGPLSAQQQRFVFKFKQGTAKLGHAFKTAKGFERQKLGRRRKTAAQESNAKDVQRIDAEIAALKVLDNGKCAHHYLCKTLLKIKAVFESPDLPDEVRTGGALSTDAAALNVHARLCNSNPVKDALPTISSELQRALGFKAVKDSLPKKRLRAKDYKDAGAGSVELVMSTAKGLPTSSRAGLDQESDVKDVDMDEVDSDGDSFGDLDDRLAPSDDEESGDGASDIDALERQLAAEGIRAKVPAKSSSTKYDLAADMSLGETDSEDESDSSPPPRKAPATKSAMFVPSLSLGGYISGSGSDLDDDIDVAPPPKNRRGQRARQKIWEQKYGAKAAHLKDDKKKAQSGRAQGWDMKRGATDGRERRGGSRGGSGGTTGRGGSRGGRAARDVGERETAKKKDPKHRDDGGPIHPSWEAAKKAKELRDNPVAFQGKKRHVKTACGQSGKLGYATTVILDAVRRDDAYGLTGKGLERQTQAVVRARPADWTGVMRIFITDAMNGVAQAAKLGDEFEYDVETANGAELDSLD